MARFTLRCDAPGIERLLEMTVRLEGELVEFSTIVLRLEARQPHKRDERSPELVRVCAWCARVADGAGGWSEPTEGTRDRQVFEPREPPGITHGMCETCSGQMEAEPGPAA